MCPRFAPRKLSFQSTVMSESLILYLVSSAKRGSCAHRAQPTKRGEPQGLSSFCWCGRRELNPYGKTTRPSNVRVCQFRHSRNGFSIIHEDFLFVKHFLIFFSNLFFWLKICIRYERIALSMQRISLTIILLCAILTL